MHCQKNYTKYVEPFVGAGDIFFHLNIDNDTPVVINDLDKNSLVELEALNPEERDYYDMEQLSTKLYKTKQKFPFLFNSDELSRELIIGNCKHQINPNELENIVDKINSLL